MHGREERPRSRVYPERYIIEISTQFTLDSLWRPSDVLILTANMLRLLDHPSYLVYFPISSCLSNPYPVIKDCRPFEGSGLLVP